MRRGGLWRVVVSCGELWYASKSEVVVRKSMGIFVAAGACCRWKVSHFQSVLTVANDYFATKFTL